MERRHHTSPQRRTLCITHNRELPRGVVTLLFLVVSRCIADEFLLGYITGSQRRSGDLEYTRPGLTISGAISLAISEVNAGPLGALGHRLNFTVAETYGEEVTSIRQTANLWARSVAAYIGPQETCVHEGRMAAAFNLPMISYFCTDYETSDKRKFPTFARSKPPDTQISKSVAAVLKYFNWTQITFLYLDSPDEAFSKVAGTVIGELRAAGIHIRRVRSWHEPYHHGYTANPFKDIISDTFRDTRIYVSLGNHNDHIGLMAAMEELDLLQKGEYWVLGVDIEQYDASAPEKYVKSILIDATKATDPSVVRGFRAFLGVLPSSPRGFGNFSVLVNRYMELPPFNYKNAATLIGGMKVIRPEAAFLYDAVHLYAGALLNALREGENPRNGSYIINSMKNTHYHSSMGYMAYMDENGDAEGNYTLIGLMEDDTITGGVGLFPVGTLTRKKHNDSNLPELHMTKKIKWIGDGPPVAEPKCGFTGEKCKSHSTEISAGVAGGVLLLLAVVSLVLYRNWKYEQELDSLLWKLDFREIKLTDEKEVNGIGSKVQKIQPLVRTSQVSLSSNPDTDFRYSSIFTEVGIYKGRLMAIKRVRKKSIDITREMKKQLKMMRDLRHDNLNGFIGACTESPNICVVTEYCTRGSLKDILDNEDVKLDCMFNASIIGDIIRGMIYLHESPIKYHGSLQSSNCLVDSRWVVKLADFGFHSFRRGEEPPTDPARALSKIEAYLYRAPELLRSEERCDGTQKGDVYSFGIVLYEIHTRRGPFGDLPWSTTEILKKITYPELGSTPFRPPLEPLESSFEFVRDCLKECWCELPEERPDFKAIRAKLRPLRKGMKPNIFDNMMAMMEKYANNLEVLVDERTDQLQEEKKKTEALLLEMLPRPVAEQLKRGNRVDPESFDCVTIYFSDIVGFTSMSAESTPLEVVDFLNDLYTCFDSIIGNYDVYKVETIGDAYMVVSGLPIRNDDQHAAEIASMSLHLLSTVQKFRVRHRPLDQLKLRIGIHSGPVCAGVVGLKMPRYCLFGDTVNTSSRMESTGSPLKIHCSKDCKLLLDRLGGYQFLERGVVPMKGKGDQLTYWLIGEDTTRASRRSPARQPPRSSLKNKHLSKSPLLRCSSLESPKKLRFASGNLLEFHNYSANSHHHHHHEKSSVNKDHLTNGMIDHSPCKKSSGSLVLESSECCSECIRTSSTSCPCIEHMAGSSATLSPSQLCVFPPLDIKKSHGNQSCFNSVPALNCTNITPQREHCSNRSAPCSPCNKNLLQTHGLDGRSNGYVITYKQPTDKLKRGNEVCKVVLIDEDNIATEWIEDNSVCDELNEPLLNDFQKSSFSVPFSNNCE